MMVKAKNSLSREQARKLVLLSQNLPSVKQKGNALNTTLSAIEHLGYIQIDTISAIQRAHHHTLWNRNPRYENSHLDQLMADQAIFEYWSHAAAYLPMKDYRYSLVRKQSIASGKENHWYERDEKLMHFILNRIDKEGALMAKDFESNSSKAEIWGSKPIRQALGNLFMHGELMISSRKNFHKVFDLSERVLPQGIDSSPPSAEEYIRFLIFRYLQANGLAQASEIAYLLKNVKAQLNLALKEMCLGGELLQIRVGDIDYYAKANAIDLLNKPLPRQELKILSPFDNLLIQRKRMQNLFDFEYQIECYVPEANRQFGYFSLPILWDDSLVARMDCKVDRKTSILHIKHLVLEPSLKKHDAFAHALAKEMESFMRFNGASTVQFHLVTPQSYQALLESAMNTIN